MTAVVSELFRERLTEKEMLTVGNYKLIINLKYDIGYLIILFI